MALPETYRMVIKQGATYREWWALELPDGTVPDLATEGNGYTIGRLIVRPSYADPPVLELTTANGGIVIARQQDAEGIWQNGYFFVSATATAALEVWGDGIFDFEISDGVDDVPVMTGPAVLSPTTTEDV